MCASETREPLTSFLHLDARANNNNVELRPLNLKPRAVRRNSIRTSIKNSWILLRRSKRESTCNDHHVGTSIQLLEMYNFFRTIDSYRSISLRILPIYLF